MENMALTHEQILAERRKYNEAEIKNFFVNFENGDSILFYVDTKEIGSELSYKIGSDTIKRFAENVTGNAVSEVYHVPQNDLQYYCIDERVWIDSKRKAEVLIEKAKGGEQ